MSESQGISRKLQIPFSRAWDEIHVYENCNLKNYFSFKKTILDDKSWLVGFQQAFPLRSSRGSRKHLRCSAINFFVTEVLRKFAIFIGKHLCQGLFLIKIQACFIQKQSFVLIFNGFYMKQTCNFIKKRLQHKCIPMNIAKFLKTPFFKEHRKWLILFFLSLLYKRPCTFLSLLVLFPSTCGAVWWTSQQVLLIQWDFQLQPVCLREKCPNTEFFLVGFSPVRTEYGKKVTHT